MRVCLEGMDEFDEEKTSGLEDVGYLFYFSIFVLGAHGVHSFALGSFRFF